MLPSRIDPSVCRCHNISSHLLSAQKYSRLHSELARRFLLASYYRHHGNKLWQLGQTKLVLLKQ